MSALCKVGSQVKLLATLFWISLLTSDNFLWERNSGKTTSKKCAALPERDCAAVWGAPAWEKLELHIPHRCLVPEEMQLLWKPCGTFCSHPSPLAVAAVSWAWGFFCLEEASVCSLTFWHHPGYLMADSGEWWLGLSEIACNRDWREVGLLTVPCLGLPSRGLVQPLCCSLWDVSRSQHSGQEELCHWVPGGAGLVPGSLQLCWGLQCQCYDCFCTRIIWNALFVVLVLFKNVRNSDVIYKTDCLQYIFCILRCMYCKKKKGKDEKWCFSTTVSSDCMSVSLSTNGCSSGVTPPFL